MGVIRKQGILTTIIAYIGIALGSVIVLYFLPKYFSPEEVGIRNLIFDIALVFTQLFTLGGGNSFTKFYPVFQDNSKKRNSLLLLIIALPIIVLVVLTIIYLLPIDLIGILFQEKSASLIPYFKYCVIIGLILSYIAIFEYYARIKNSFVIPRANREIIFRIITIALILLYGLNQLTFNQFWIAISGFHILILISNIALVNSLEKLTLQFDKTLFQKNSIKPIIEYSLFAALTGGTTILVLKFDSVMVASLIGLEQTAIYTIAIFIAMVIETPRKSLNLVTNALLSKAFASNDIKTIDAIYKKTSVNQVIIGGAIFSIIWLNIDYLFMIMPKGDFYSAGKTIILILGIAKMVDMISSCNTSIISYSSSYKFNLLSIMFLLIATVTLNLLFIPRYGILGAAMATLISVSSFNAIQTFFVYRTIKLVPFHRKLILPVLTCISLVAFSYLGVSINNPFVGILLNSSAIGLIYLALILFSNSADDLKDLIQKSYIPFL